MKDLDSDNEIRQQILEMMSQGLPTLEIYKKTCEILFFQHGIMPTPTKLYALVRKGSMTTPGKAIQEFLAQQREKGRIELEIPEMPESLKTMFTEALKETWRHASQISSATAGEQNEQHQRNDRYARWGKIQPCRRHAMVDATYIRCERWTELVVTFGTIIWS